MFSAPVAEAAQDLLDRERLPSALVAVAARGDAGRRRAAKAIHAWSAAMKDWRAKLAALSDTMTDVAGGQGSAMGSIRLELLDMEESISASLDSHLAAVWMSIPFETRVLRIRALLVHLDGMLSVAESAGTFVDHRAAVDGWMRVHDLVEERAQLDPKAAIAAGYDVSRHDAAPMRWGEGGDRGDVPRATSLLHPGPVSPTSTVSRISVGSEGSP